MDNNEIPKSAMLIMAHPDDAEFTMAGTVAAWTKAGCRVIYVLCTDGNAGSHDPGMTREKLAGIRRAEQRAACVILGVRDIVFLGHDDAQLQPTLELRKELVEVIRRYKPEAVFTSDPTMLFGGDRYINHPDHRAASQAALDAVAPACDLPLLWPETGTPHRVSQVYIHSFEKNSVWIDITETLDLKIAALKKHASQMDDWDPTEMIKQWAAEEGKNGGMPYAEGYRLITL
jgi:LmbE family N-acetylglucosaminyl deacetylase